MKQKCPGCCNLKSANAGSSKLFVVALVTLVVMTFHFGGGESPRIMSAQ